MLWWILYFAVGFILSLPGGIEVKYRDREPKPWVVFLLWLPILGLVWLLYLSGRLDVKRKEKT